MALQNYAPAAADAQGLARVFETASEEDFSVFDPEYATAKHVYKPMCDEILALISRNYGRNRYGAVISPSISGDQNDYAPTGYATATRIRITATGAGRTITGFTAGNDGDVITFENVGALFITFANQSASSSAANRFALGGLGTAGNPNASIWTNDTISFVYDATTARWRCVAKQVNEPAFHAYRATSVQSINNITLTKVQFNTEGFDTHGWFDNATNYRFQPLLPGKYLFSWGIGLVSLADTKFFQTQLVKNGSNVAYGCQNPNGGAADAISTGSKLVTMNGSTDYIEVHCYHDHGSARDVFAADGLAFFTGARVSD